VAGVEEAGTEVAEVTGKCHGIAGAEIKILHIFY